MRVIQIGKASFNADYLEGMSREELKENLPHIEEKVFDLLCVQLKAPKKAKKVEKVESFKKDKPTKD